MRSKFSFLFLILPLTLLAQQPWQQITVPTTREVAANFLLLRESTARFIGPSGVVPSLRSASPPNSMP